MSGTFQGRIAFASITFPGGTATIASQSGDFDAIANPNPGEINLTLKSEIDPAEAVYLLTVTDLSGGTAWLRGATDSTVLISTTDLAAAPADLPCNIAILIKPLV